MVLSECLLPPWSGLFLGVYVYVIYIYVMKVLVPQLYPVLCDLMDFSLSGSSVHGILLARVLEWVAISFSRGFSQPSDQT